jgi:hypothetical protein
MHRNISIERAGCELARASFASECAGRRERAEGFCECWMEEEYWSEDGLTVVDDGRARKLL